MLRLILLCLEYLVCRQLMSLGDRKQLLLPEQLGFVLRERAEVFLMKLLDLKFRRLVNLLITLFYCFSLCKIKFLSDHQNCHQIYQNSFSNQPRHHFCICFFFSPTISHQPHQTQHHYTTHLVFVVDVPGLRVEARSRAGAG